MAMELMSTAFAGAFKSERLIYKAMEDTDAHKDWLFKNVWSTPVNAGLANPSVFMPASTTNCKKDFETIINKTLLPILICLPASGKAAGENKPESEEDQKEKDDEDDTIIGYICLSKSGNEAFRRKTAIGIQIADKYQNKGYGREAINWALDWAFTWADMHRVEIGTASFNDRGAALYESIGFKREGVTREAFFMNRKWHDLIEFGMLVHEWEELRNLSISQTEVSIHPR